MHEIMNIPSTTVKVPKWLLPTARYAIAALLTLSGPLVMLGAMGLGFLVGSPSLGGFGLIAGALLSACGGLGLLWSLPCGRRR